MNATANQLHMSVGEIKKSYREAKCPEEQIRILADLNACSVKQICDILCVAVPKSSDSPRSHRHSECHRWTEAEDRIIINMCHRGYIDRVIAETLELPLSIVNQRRIKLCGTKGGKPGKRRR